LTSNAASQRAWVGSNSPSSYSITAADPETFSPKKFAKSFRVQVPRLPGRIKCGPSRDNGAQSNETENDVTFDSRSDPMLFETDQHCHNSGQNNSTHLVDKKPSPIPGVETVQGLRESERYSYYYQHGTLTLKHAGTKKRLTGFIYNKFGR
jgi:hypothetical protein